MTLETNKSKKQKTNLYEKGMVLFMLSSSSVFFASTSTCLIPTKIVTAFNTPSRSTNIHSSLTKRRYRHFTFPPSSSLSSPRRNFLELLRIYSTTGSGTSNDDIATESTATASSSTFHGRKAERFQRAKDAKKKRSQFIGLAKSVDRGTGQYLTTYKPGDGPDGTTFKALSGLPASSLSSSSSSSRLFTVLGIESSCDDTGAAVVRSDGVILGEGLASQESIHEEWGGVVPNLAQQAHETNIDRVINEALSKANMTSVDDVDAIGVTVGPGLEICLRVGCNRARDLAMKYNKPFVGVHHLEAHILMARMGNDAELQFPFLALLVSGGHCQIMKCLGIGRYEILGGTLDDSLGEAFDKTARLLGLPVGGGGGPAVERLAMQGNATAVPLTVPLSRRRDCDFSYAGLKTNVRRAAEQMAADHGVEFVTDLPEAAKADIAASFQNVAITHLEQRLRRVIKIMETDEPNINRLALVGGVAANTELRNRLTTLCDANGWKMVVPPPRLCTDQGAMAAYAAVERLRVGSSDDPSTQIVFARYPFFYYGNQGRKDAQ
jgi:tRNA threonylcarbamoyl adenosine modification protein TsaD